MDVDIDAIRILTWARPNVLLIGSEHALERTLHVVAPFLPAPVIMWHSSEHVCLPEAPPATLILHAVDKADTVQQAQLLTWLDHRSRATRLISTATSDIFPMIARGAFQETLYYRLNHLTLHASDPQAIRGAAT